MPNETSSHQAYAGTFRHSLDNKHRVTIPARWRQEGEEAFDRPAMNATLTNLPKPLTGAVGVMDHRNVQLAVVITYFRCPLASGSCPGVHSRHLRV